MQYAASPSRGRLTADRRIEAESRITPAEVTQEWSGSGERKNTTAGNEVWVSCSSRNHCSPRRHRIDSLAKRSTRQLRPRTSTADGGDPPRSSIPATMFSRRENTPQIAGRDVNNRGRGGSP